MLKQNPVKTLTYAAFPRDLKNTSDQPIVAVSIPYNVTLNDVVHLPYGKDAGGLGWIRSGRPRARSVFSTSVAWRMK